MRIKACKTDPFQKGCLVHISRVHFPLCALQAVLAYLAVRGNSGGPLFLFQDGRPLTRAVLTARLREILAGAGVSGNFSSHSFRIGAATVAARNGVPDHLIQALGRWSSSAYQLYICTPSESLALFSSRCWLSWLVTRVYAGNHADRRKSRRPVLLSFSGSLAACLRLPAMSGQDSFNQSGSPWQLPGSVPTSGRTLFMPRGQRSCGGPRFSASFSPCLG